MNLCRVRGRYWRQCDAAALMLGLPAMLAAMKLLLKWLMSAGALLLVAAVFSGVQVQSYGSALLAVVVISLLNTLVRPLLVVLTLPVTVVTVGLFLFVINGLMLWAASGLLGGLHVSGFWAAVWGAILYSLLGMAIESLLARLFP
jgi:putative membrane protein